jgi:hypothetical protein
MSSYKHVNYSCDDTIAASLDAVGRLVYRSNILGDDQRFSRRRVADQCRDPADLRETLCHGEGDVE